MDHADVVERLCGPLELGVAVRRTKKMFTRLDLTVPSLRRGHANLLCIVPILTDDPRREFDAAGQAFKMSVAQQGRSKEHTDTEGFLATDMVYLIAAPCF